MPGDVRHSEANVGAGTAAGCFWQGLITVLEVEIPLGISSGCCRVKRVTSLEVGGTLIARTIITRHVKDVARRYVVIVCP
jgi:hypothetical protein